jgi:hypothetical protein
MPVLAPLVLVLIALVLPEAEDPFPDRIGPLAPLTGAGAGAVLAGIVLIRASTSRRETAMKWGALGGFVVGGALYLFALIVQVG